MTSFMRLAVVEDLLEGLDRHSLKCLKGRHAFAPTMSEFVHFFPPVRMPTHPQPDAERLLILPFA
jgi:hypothetical protein